MCAWHGLCVHMPKVELCDLLLYCVEVCRSTSHATINMKRDRNLWKAGVCVGRYQAVNPSRYHWQAQRWEINIYSKLPQITSRDFSMCFLSLLLLSSIYVPLYFCHLLFTIFCRPLSLITFSLPMHCFIDKRQHTAKPRLFWILSTGHVYTQAHTPTHTK